MSNVVNIKDYRHRLRRHYLDKYASRLDSFLGRFISTYLDIDFMNIAQYYVADQLKNEELAWDYRDFRDIIREAIENAFGQELFLELEKQSWYDSRWISQEEVLDRCLSFYILGSCVTGTGQKRF